MESRERVKAFLSFGLLLSGLFVLAYSTVLDVFQDPRRTELMGSIEQSTNMAWILFSALLVAWGVFLGLASVSRARGRGRLTAWAVGASSMFLLWTLHSRLFINSFSVAWDAPGRTGDATVTFSAGYFMHSGSYYTFPVIYVIFLVSALLLAAVVGAATYLLAPDRFSRAFGRRAKWEPTESNVVVLSLFVVLSLVVFLVSLVRFAVDADLATAQDEQNIQSSGGFLADNLVALHYLTAFLVGVLVLTIGARVFLVNWGTPGPYSRRRVLQSLVSVGRIERILMASVVGFNLLLLIAPPIVPPSYLSQDLVFRLTSRSLYFFFLLTLIPYAFYFWGQKRLQRLLEDGQGPAQWRTPFSNASLRLVLIHLSGILLMTTLFVAIASTGNEDTLGFMVGYAALTAIVFLTNGVSFELDSGVPRPRLRGAHGAGPFFGFVVTGLLTALMLWGAGNTFQATYYAGTNTMTVENESVWGVDILSRLAAALTVGLVVVVALGILMDAARVRRPVLGHYLSTLISVSLVMLVVFSVGVWSTRVREDATDAFTGFAFHQGGTLESTLVAMVLVGTMGALYYSFGRIFQWTSQKWILASSGEAKDPWGGVRRIR